MPDDRSWTDEPYDPRWDSEADSQTYSRENLVLLGRNAANDPTLTEEEAVARGIVQLDEWGYVLDQNDRMAKIVQEVIEEQSGIKTYVFVKRR
jgi:hypothetical protein